MTGWPDGRGHVDHKGTALPPPEPQSKLDWIDWTTIIGFALVVTGLGYLSVQGVSGLAWVVERL